MLRTAIKRAGLGLALLSLVSLLGGDWFLLQSIAWGRMLVNYSAAYGFQEGVVRTFDGDHPCAMCCAIKKARVREAPTDALTRVTLPMRLVAVAPATPVEMGLVRPFLYLPPDVRGTCLRGREKPPVPPPRPIA